MIDAPPTTAEWDEMLAADKARHDAGTCEFSDCLYCEGEWEAREEAKKTVIKFGKYAGCTLNAVPRDYLVWIVQQKSRSVSFHDTQRAAALIIGKPARQVSPTDKRAVKKPKTRGKQAKKRRQMLEAMKRDARFHARMCD